MTLTWPKTRAASYIAKYSRDLTDWGSDMGDGLTEDRDERPEDTDHITVTFPLTGERASAPSLFFRIEEG